MGTRSASQLHLARLAKVRHFPTFTAVALRCIEAYNLCAYPKIQKSILTFTSRCSLYRIQHITSLKLLSYPGVKPICRALVASLHVSGTRFLQRCVLRRSLIAALLLLETTPQQQAEAAEKVRICGDCLYGMDLYYIIVRI
jgi:hypothetical protein